jgi:cytochrome oxidase Cu insertion factor (SCO1/SenC/PrrC family)
LEADQQGSTQKNQNKEKLMPKVELNCPAPDFQLNDFNGKPVRLADFRDQKHVILVFNRGFV